MSQTKIAPTFLNRLVRFGLGQAWSAVFGGVLLAAIIVTSYVELPWLSQYDWLFLIAIATQVVLLVTKLEKPHEVITILLFHFVGLGMELFKTSDAVGSWQYPGDAVFMIGNVPLFSGFMYAAVGSYIARSWRVLDLKYDNYPKRICTLLLALLIYGNFFTHHYIVDIRLALFLWVALLYRNTTVSYKLADVRRTMPLLLGFFLISFFIWIAENIGTFTNTWLYPEQVGDWSIVSLHKLGSWLLLMIISFVMIDMLHYYRTSKLKSKKIPR